jgi:hypothetical protein
MRHMKSKEESIDNLKLGNEFLSLEILIPQAASQRHHEG